MFNFAGNNMCVKRSDEATAMLIVSVSGIMTIVEKHKTNKIN